MYFDLLQRHLVELKAYPVPLTWVGESSCSLGAGTHWARGLTGQ